MTMQQLLTTAVNPANSMTSAGRVRRALASLLAAGIVMIAAASPAAAEVYTVDSASDEAGAPGMTLRKALAQAEASPEDDVIVFADHVTEIHLTQGQLWIGFMVNPPNSGALMIDGHINGGQDRVKIDGGGQSVVLDAGSGFAYLTGLELVNGNGSLGGGLMVWDLAEVVLEDSWIHDNHAMNGGGGICCLGVLTIRDTLIESNGSSDGGGGLYAIGGYGGRVEATDTWFVGNDARSFGGGILNDESVVTLTNAIVSGNTARNGGGIYNHVGPLSFSGGDLSGNLADRKGNDIYYTAGSVTGDLNHLDVYEEQPKGRGGGGRK